jgi:hypothetical protein
MLLMKSIAGQVAINTDASAPHNSAMLDIKSNNKGFLPPRMTWPQIQAIQNPAPGLLVFDEGLKAIRMFNGFSWVVIGPKEHGLNDPPGNFSNLSTATGSSNARGNKVVVGIDKKVYVTGVLDQSLIFGNDTLTTNGSNDIFFAVFDSSGNYLWSKKIGGTNYDYVNDIYVNTTGIFLCGYFSGTVDFDAGAGTDNHTAVVISPFFTKYDLAGNFVWAKHLTPTNTSYSSNIIADNAGYSYLCGYFTAGTIDADPGAGTLNLTSLGGWEGYLAKYDSNGNLVWARKIGNTGNDLCDGLIFVNGTLVFAGLFAGTVDFDPSAATFNLTSAGISDYFLTRFDTSGNLLWAKAIGTPAGETTINHMLTMDPAGNICFASLFSGTIDVNPDAGVLNLVSAGGLDFFIAKYNSSGALLPWAFRIGGTLDDHITDISVDNSDNIYITGSYQGTVDFDPSGTIQNLVSSGSADVFIAKYSSSASTVFIKSMGGMNYEATGSIAAFPSGKVVFITGVAGTPYIAFNGERVLSSGFFLARYEE